MFHVVVILLATALSALMWLLIHSAPPVLSRIMPDRVTFAAGASFFILGLFIAFASAYVLRSADAMLGGFLQAYVGLWLMLATSASARGSDLDREFMKRLFFMMGIVMTVIIASLYIPDARSLALIEMALVLTGLLVTRNFERFLNRAR